MLHKARLRLKLQFGTYFQETFKDISFLTVVFMPPD